MFKNYKIYKLSVPGDISNKCYIGCTKQRLCSRLAQHKLHYQMYLNKKFNYVTSFDIFKLGNPEISLLETCKHVKTQNELSERERHYMNQFGLSNCVNKKINKSENEKKILRREYYIKQKEIKKEQKKEKLKKDMKELLKVENLTVDDIVNNFNKIKKL